MEIGSFIPVIISFIFLNLEFLLGYFMVTKNSKLYRKVDLNLNSPALNLYCYNKSNMKKLFWITLLDLESRGYYIIKSKKEKKNIKIKEKDTKELKEYELIVLEYINNLIKDESTLKDMEFIVYTDISFMQTLNKFSLSLKKEAKKTYGNIDKKSPYLIPSILTLIYGMHMFYSLYSKFNIIHLLLLSVPAILLTLLISHILKNILRNITVKKFCIYSFISFIISIISYLVWTKNYSSEVVIFYVILGITLFSYQLLIIINIYFINNFTYYKNKTHKDIVMNLIYYKNEKNSQRDYIYSRCLNLDSKKNNEIYDEYFRIFNV